MKVAQESGKKKSIEEKEKKWDSRGKNNATREKKGEKGRQKQRE